MEINQNKTNGGSRIYNCIKNKITKFRNDKKGGAEIVAVVVIIIIVLVIAVKLFLPEMWDYFGEIVFPAMGENTEKLFDFSK